MKNKKCLFLAVLMFITPCLFSNKATKPEVVYKEKTTETPPGTMMSNTCIPGFGIVSASPDN